MTTYRAMTDTLPPKDYDELKPTDTLTRLAILAGGLASRDAWVDGVLVTTSWDSFLLSRVQKGVHFCKRNQPNIWDGERMIPRVKLEHAEADPPMNDPEEVEQ